MDGVVYDYDWSHRMAAMSELTGVPEPELARRWWHHLDGEEQAEAGRYPTGADYLAALSTALGTTVSADDFVRVRRASMTARPAVVPAVTAAARVGQVTVLTNNGALVDERFAELAPELVPIVGVEHLRHRRRDAARRTRVVRGPTGLRALIPGRPRPAHDGSVRIGLGWLPAPAPAAKA
ncbi:hypothetical protein [Pseudonocardia humida]|uniref:Hydrolase of the HAD superfamily n=1 Tax=Pseudonocardia humida TaxID=2800819 RepID=A0ABT1A346_9PSEU|nr:hypothetical protein [Pseudonocardia humida]MCO1657422.1 hypothetical protein [Pseudonocardia humida]